MQFLSALLVLLCAGYVAAAGQARPGSEDHVLVVTLDGVRWQEVFSGAARALISADAGGVADTTAVLRRFWRATAEARPGGSVAG